MVIESSNGEAETVCRRIERNRDMKGREASGRLSRTGEVDDGVCV